MKARKLSDLKIKGGERGREGGKQRERERRKTDTERERKGKREIS